MSKFLQLPNDPAFFTIESPDSSGQMVDVRKQTGSLPGPFHYKLDLTPQVISWMNGKQVHVGLAEPTGPAPLLINPQDIRVVLWCLQDQDAVDFRKSFNI